jgi:hypothetical protein
VVSVTGPYCRILGFLDRSRSLVIVAIIIIIIQVRTALGIATSYGLDD